MSIITNISEELYKAIEKYLTYLKKLKKVSWFRYYLPESVSSKVSRSRLPADY